MPDSFPQKRQTRTRRALERAARLLHFSPSPGEQPSQTQKNAAPQRPSRLKAYFLDSSMGTKFFLAYLAVLTVFLLVSFLGLYPLIRRNVENNIEQNLKNATQGVLNTVTTAGEVSVQSYLKAVAEKNRDTLAALYKLQQKGELSEKEAKKRAAFILLSQTVGKTGYIYCIDTKNIIQVHPVPEMRKKDLSAHYLSHEQTARKEGYLEYEWKNPGEKQMRQKALYMTYFEPWDWIISVSSYRDEFSQLINVDTFRDRIRSIRLGKLGYVYVLNSKGDIIVHNSLSGNVYDAQSPDGTYFVREICEKKNGRITYQWRHWNEPEFQQKLAVFNYIPQFDWIVVSISYEKEFYAPIRTVRNSFLLIVALLSGVVFLLVRRLSSYIVVHLNRLLYGFQRTGQHDFSVRLDKDSGDEFGKLAEGFNDAMTKLDSYNASLKEEISQRQSAEEDLLDANEKYKAILRAATSFSIIGTDSNGIIKLFNTGAELMLGYKAEEVIDKTTPALFHVPEEIASRSRELNLDPASTPFSGFALGNLNEAREWTHIRKDGTRLPVLLYISPQRDRDGKLIGFLGIASDITERKRFEETMRAQKMQAQYLQEQAEAANRAKSAFIANMSHELRTPLNVVMASANILLADMLGALNPKQTEYIETISTSGRHLLALINDILNLAKIEAGKINLNIQQHSALDIVGYAVTFVLETAMQAGVKVKFEPSEDSAGSIAADDIKLKQILYNLLSNAIKFTPAGGKVTVSTRRTTLEEVRTADRQAAEQLAAANPPAACYLEIKVADSGIGISPENMDKLFKQFSQVESSNTRSYEGTGLGLVISKTLVELHKGCIWVKSEVGNGSAFTVVLPYADQPPLS